MESGQRVKEDPVYYGVEDSGQSSGKYCEAYMESLCSKNVAEWEFHGDRHVTLTWLMNCGESCPKDKQA